MHQGSRGDSEEGRCTLPICIPPVAANGDRVAQLYKRSSSISKVVQSRSGYGPGPVKSGKFVRKRANGEGAG